MGQCPYPEDDEVEVVVRDADGRLALLYLPTHSPWLNPIDTISQPDIEH
jgi:putative transposase